MFFWNILHILAMFVAFAFTTGMGVFVIGIARAGDVRAIRTAVSVARPFNTAGAVILILGVVFGFATVAAIGFSFTSKWLLIAYVLVILIVAIGLGVHRAWMERLAKAAATSPNDHPSPELAALIDDRMNAVAGPISGLLWIAVIAIMVMRPS